MRQLAGDDVQRHERLPVQCLRSRVVPEGVYAPTFGAEGWGAANEP